MIAMVYLEKKKNIKNGLKFKLSLLHEGQNKSEYLH